MESKEDQNKQLARAVHEAHKAIDNRTNAQKLRQGKELLLERPEGMDFATYKKIQRNQGKLLKKMRR